MRLNERQEIILADKTFDLPNFFAVGFVISQFLSKEKDFILLVLGFIIYIVLAIFALWLRR